MQSRVYILLILLIPLLLVMPSCRTPGENILWLAEELDRRAGPNHVFAFYDSANLLVNDPIEGVLRAARTSPEPFTDVYVVSHGWNFTLSGAIANYQRYLRTYEELRATEIKTEFRPLFVFVSWVSVARPLGETAASMLPFGLDESIALVTGVSDAVVFHIPSAWKQSLNAATNALGRHFPDYYLEPMSPGVAAGRRDPVTESYAQEVVSRTTLFRRTGQDTPVSALLYQLLDLNERKRLANGSVVKIHCVGHSYGSKLMTLAAVEALRRLDYAERPTQDRIDSLVLFNAAFHPSEVRYAQHPFLTSGVHECDPADYLTDIPRKALVYSNTDFANGLTFDLSQVVLNSFHSHVGQQHSNATVEYLRSKGWSGKTLIAPTVLIGGALQLAYSTAMGSSMWAWRRTVNTPQDFWYHLRHSETSRGWPALLRYPFNAVHFFLPLDKLWGGAADQRGLFRHSTPALGRTGLYRHAAGRVFEVGTHRYPSYSNSMPLSKFTRGGELESVVYDELAARIPSRVGPYDDATLFYSVDASQILSGWIPFYGAHGALREEDGIVIETVTPPVRTTRIESTIRFVYNFTQQPH